MPERKRLVAGTRWCAHFVAVVVAPVQRRTRNEKMAPENRGHKVGQECLKVNAAGGRSTAAALESSRLGKQPWKAAAWESEAEIGKVAVAYRDAGVRHQQAIDGDHHPIEQAGGRCDGKGCSLGHFWYSSDGNWLPRCSLESNLGMPDASNNPFVCMAAYSSLQRSILFLRVVPSEASKKGRRKPAALEGIEIIAYSAAALRGGSSAPESWISAT
jgi:hypothetical protein